MQGSPIGAAGPSVFGRGRPPRGQGRQVDTCEPNIRVTLFIVHTVGDAYLMRKRMHFYCHVFDIDIFGLGPHGLVTHDHDHSEWEPEQTKRFLD